MMRFFFFLLLLIAGAPDACFAQKTEPQDTFFLAKKKGLLGKLGKSISRSVPPL